MHAMGTVVRIPFSLHHHNYKWKEKKTISRFNSFIPVTRLQSAEAQVMVKNAFSNKFAIPTGWARAL